MVRDSSRKVSGKKPESALLKVVEATGCCLGLNCKAPCASKGALIIDGKLHRVSPCHAGRFGAFEGTFFCVRQEYEYE